MIRQIFLTKESLLTKLAHVLSVNTSSFLWTRYDVELIAAVEVTGGLLNSSEKRLRFTAFPMMMERGSTAEPPRAIVTREWLLTGMDPSMVIQEVLAFEAPGAEVAHERFVFPVRVGHMGSQPDGRFEQLPRTFGTLELLSVGMDTLHVRPQL